MLSHGDEDAAEGELQDLIHLAETFGFYLARLDIRQESTLHTHAVAEILQVTGLESAYHDLNSQQRMLLLEKVINDGLTQPLVIERLSRATQDILAVFDLIADSKRDISPLAIGQYVISMTHHASDIMEVHSLAAYAA